jgi:hypothetical protein
MALGLDLPEGASITETDKDPKCEMAALQPSPSKNLVVQV